MLLSWKRLSNWVTNIQQQFHWIHRSLWHAFPAILQARCSMIFWSDTFIRISLKLPPEGRFFQDAAAAGSWNERQPARKLHNMHTCAYDHTYSVYLSWNIPHIIQHPGFKPNLQKISEHGDDQDAAMLISAEARSINDPKNAIFLVREVIGKTTTQTNQEHLQFHHYVLAVQFYYPPRN